MSKPSTSKRKPPKKTEKTFHKCKNCVKSFKFKSQLQRHLKTHEVQTKRRRRPPHESWMIFSVVTTSVVSTGLNGDKESRFPVTVQIFEIFKKHSVKNLKCVEQSSCPDCYKYFSDYWLDAVKDGEEGVTQDEKTASSNDNSENEAAEETDTDDSRSECCFMCGSFYACVK